MVKNYYTEYDYIYKILLIGDSGVGKSSILVRFTDNVFSNNFVSTIGVDFRVKTIEIDGAIIKLQIWDTAGQERFKTITNSYYRGSNGAIVVFDLADRDSFENLDYWFNDLKSYSKENIPVIIVGNKSDLLNEQQVTKEEAEKYAKEKNCNFYATSSKDSVNIFKIFEVIAAKIKKQNKVPKNINKLLNEKHKNIPFKRKNFDNDCCV